ncbi:unnamed protein product [Polarella glacialis]|uniref:Coatomer subunit delta n=1 Tax=Polarella glacialis TaxID=89957 RepID=A0A813LUB5_POLGL|nr:unnamed protein product [Polarella glacialis]
MVVLSAAVISTGKTLVARQFVEMTRLRIEGLLSAFQKLVDSGRDHTFIETETVRYLYQPMESLHLLVITNKSSNILEDLETLRLLAKVVQDCCQIQVNEENVLKHAFDIVFSFDEVVSFGHRESVTLSQIKSYTEMDSHEEKLHQMIEQSKINEAREMAKKKQLELKKARLQDGGGSGPKMDGFGGGFFHAPPGTMPMRLGLLCEGTRGDCQPYVAFGLELVRQSFEVCVFTTVTHTKFVRSFGLRCEGVFYDVQACLAREDVKDAMSTGSFFNLMASTQPVQDEEFPKFFPHFWSSISAFAPEVCEAHEVPSLSKRQESTGGSAQNAAGGTEPVVVASSLPRRLRSMRKQRSIAEMSMQGTPITISDQNVKLSELASGIDSRAPEMGPRHHLTAWWVLEASHEMERVKEGDENFGGANAEALASFLGSGPPPVYLGWGSMTAISAAHMTKLAVATLLKTGQRGIVMKRWAELGPEHLDTAELSEYAAENVFFASVLPHEWLFPKCSRIVSHGGSGTTAATLRSGRPAVITPVFLDQFDFAESVETLGVGVSTCQFNKVSAQQLASCILKCASDESIMAKAAELGARLDAENGVSNAVAILRAFVSEWTHEEW